MKALIVPDNIISQVVQDNEEFPVAYPFKWVDCPAECKAFEWTYDGVNFAPPIPQPRYIPKLTPRQLRFILNKYNLRTTVEQLVDQRH